MRCNPRCYADHTGQPCTSEPPAYGGDPALRDADHRAKLAELAYGADRGRNLSANDRAACRWALSQAALAADISSQLEQALKGKRKP